jgi:hypothetical protein
LTAEELRDIEVAKKKYEEFMAKQAAIEAEERRVAGWVLPRLTHCRLHSFDN